MKLERRSSRTRSEPGWRRRGRVSACILLALGWGCADPSWQAGSADAKLDCRPELFDSAPGAFDRFLFLNEQGLSGYRDFSGTVAIAPRFVIAYEFSQEGIAAAIDPQLGPVFIGVDGRVLAKALLFDNGPDYFQEGRARMVENGKVGFIDRTGLVVVEPRFDFAWPFCGGVARVCLGCVKGQGGDHFEIDIEGRVLAPASDAHD